MRLKKKVFYAFWVIVLVVLAIVRYANPGVTRNSRPATDEEKVEGTVPAAAPARHGLRRKRSRGGDDGWGHHRITSVPGYKRSFPDLQSVQIEAAMKYGVPPVRDREEAELRKSGLVYVGSSPYYVIDKRMNASIPYLVPRASRLLQAIGRNYLDSLSAKGVPLHKVIVSSVLRTEADVARLVRRNSNASDQSCHRFGTTFDICYNRYETVSPPGEKRRAVSTDTLKWVLAEVLRDMRQSQRCYIKYEVKQGCFHITTR